MSKAGAVHYYRLIIKASPRTDIWLADDDGHLVQKERGSLDTSLLPGDYVVEFGLGSQMYAIHLEKDSEYSQAEIQAGPSCPRPEVKLAPLYTAKQGQYLAFIYYFTKIHGEPPSEAEMQRYFRVTPPSVHQMVLTLESKGLIARIPVRVALSGCWWIVRTSRTWDSQVADARLGAPRPPRGDAAHLSMPISVRDWMAFIELNGWVPGVEGYVEQNDHENPCELKGTMLDGTETK